MTPEEQAIIQWGKILDQRERGGTMVTDSAAYHALKHIGGKGTLDNTANHEWLRREFDKAYLAHAKAGTEKPPETPKSARGRTFSRPVEAPMVSPHPAVPVPRTRGPEGETQDDTFFRFKRMRPREKVDFLMWQWWHNWEVKQQMENIGLHRDPKANLRPEVFHDRCPLFRPDDLETWRNRRHLEEKFNVPPDERLRPEG